MDHSNVQQGSPAAWISLLWPPQHDRATHSQGLSDQQALDLGLDVLVRALDWDGGHARHVRTTLMALVADPDVIRYRQQIFAELRDRPQVREALARLLPELSELARPRSAAWAQDSPLLLVPPRLSDLEHYVTCVESLYHALTASGEWRSEGLRALSAAIAEIRDDPQFQALVAELPTLRAQLDHVASLTIGINLDRDLRPASATLVAINSEPFVGPRSLTQRLLGRPAAPSLTGSTALRSIAERSPEADVLARDLQKLLEEVVQPVAQALERYGRIHARPLAALEPEIAFYLGAIRFAERLHARGLPTVLPQISATVHTLAHAYNPALAIQLAASNGSVPSTLITNPIDFEHGRLVFLTGPNRGGKTTYLRAVALNQVLFQAGVSVAAAEATITPVDAILTHFPPIEGIEPGAGRLDDEARRIRAMFMAATERSLLLFNEPFTSTGEHEAQGIARDVLRALRLLGARTIYVTHLHALADELEQINVGEGATIVSWVAGVADDASRTYLIRPGKPTARSYAHTIAEQHGITYDQLVRQLEARNSSIDKT